MVLAIEIVSRKPLLSQSTRSQLHNQIHLLVTLKICLGRPSKKSYDPNPILREKSYPVRLFYIALRLLVDF